MVHHIACPLCLSEPVIRQFNCTDHSISKEIFPICRCTICGFRFTQDFPEEDEIWRYYESVDYISHSDTSKGFSNKLYRIARYVMLNRKKGIVNKITGLKKGILLDIGSGTGHFANIMKNAGWLVKGIEINEKARNNSKLNFGLDILKPEDITDLKTGSFDCITLWHVLEHFHDPDKYMYEISRLLKPDGSCIVALPNCNSFDSKHYESYWAAYDVPRHLWHFNPDTFRLFAEKTGFIIQQVKNLPLDVFYISTLSEKYKKSELSFIKGICKAIAFAFLTIFNLEKSSSVIYILRKSKRT